MVFKPNVDDLVKSHMRTDLRFLGKSPKISLSEHISTFYEFINVESFVKNPSAVLRLILCYNSLPARTLHFSGFARPAFGTFYSAGHFDDLLLKYTAF